MTTSHETALLQRIGPSVVAATITIAGEEYSSPAVVVGRGIVAAYQALVRRPGVTTEALVSMRVTQGDRRWSAECNNERADWETCALALSGESDLPAVSTRWSRTLGEGERLLAVDLAEFAPDHGIAARDARLFGVAGVVIETFPAGGEKQHLEPYERSHYAAARFSAIPRMGALVFDRDGALAGCVEFVSKPRDDERIVVPGEWLSGYNAFHFSYVLSRLDDRGALRQVLEMFEAVRERNKDPRLFCLAAQIYERCGRVEEALDALLQASELQPGDRWIAQQLRRLGN